MGIISRAGKAFAKTMSIGFHKVTIKAIEEKDSISKYWADKTPQYMFTFINELDEKITEYFNLEGYKRMIDLDIEDLSAKAQELINKEKLPAKQKLAFAAAVKLEFKEVSTPKDPNDLSKGYHDECYAVRTSDLCRVPFVPTPEDERAEALDADPSWKGNRTDQALDILGRVPNALGVEPGEEIQPEEMKDMELGISVVEMLDKQGNPKLSKAGSPLVKIHYFLTAEEVDVKIADEVNA